MVSSGAMGYLEDLIGPVLSRHPGELTSLILLGRCLEADL